MNNEFDDEEIIDIFDDEQDSRRRYIVCKEGKYSLSKKKNGDAVVQKWFDSIKEVENFNQPTYVVSMGEIYYIVDVDLNPIFDFTLPKYDYYEIIYSNREPLKPKYLCVKKDNMYGVLDLQGNILVDFMFDNVITPASFEAWSQGQLYDDTLAVLFINKGKDNQKVGFIVEYEAFKEGKLVIIDKYIEPIYDSWESRTVVFDIDDLEVVYEGEKGYFDVEGNFTKDSSKAYIGIESAVGYNQKGPISERLMYLYNKEGADVSFREFLKKHKASSWFDLWDDKEEVQKRESTRWERPYIGSYARDEMGYSADDIDTIFDGDPDAYWNID